ncbi:hypothetical protein LPJ66_000568 [Kickxella alabastrina]|uniref:Uncharacterized protein n=1 Tax=Kickxella alabastrina TaxID=61397 RepID=A0ACC1IVN6_9FUNG|nr:hypothetical protein LPJ66_000568 [Kickxella alabastrina]
MRQNTGTGAATAAAPTTAWLANANSSINAISSENIDPVLEYLLSKQDEAVSGSQIVDTAKVFKALADMNRSPETRQILTSTSLAQVSCAILKRTEGDLIKRGSAADSERAERVFLLVQVLRCICNLSADNNAGRADILKHGGIESLANVLISVDEVWKQPLPVGQAAFGAVLNVSLDNEPCTSALIAAGALQPHLKALSPESAVSSDSYQVWSLVSMSLDNMCENANAVPQFEKHADFAQTILRSLARLSRLLLDSGADEMDSVRRAMKGAQRTLLWILCEALEKSPALPKQLCQPESVLAFFDILEFYLVNGAAAAEASDTDSEEGGCDEGCSSAVAPVFPPNKPMPQVSNRYADAVTQVIVAISGDDNALALLFDSQSLMNRLLSILSTDRGSAQDTRSQRLDGMAAAASLCLGNLARTDEHCTRLVAEHPALVRTLIHEWFAPRTTNVRTRHAASGVLKNLCLPLVNKQHMVDFGVVPVAFANIDTMVIPIQANSISILRHLLNGPPAASIILNMFEPVDNGKGAMVIALADLLKVVKQTDIDAIRCEGTRLVSAIAKKIYLGVNSSDEAAQQMVDRAQEILQAESYDLVTPLVKLVMLDGQRHPLLQQESLVALTVLASTSRDKSRHVQDIVRMLSSAVSLPMATPAKSADEEEEGEEKAEEEDVGAKKKQLPLRSFSEILKSIVKQEGAVWPQAMMQAKSLLKSLQCQLEDTMASDSNDAGFDADGLYVLRTELLPLGN